MKCVGSHNHLSPERVKTDPEIQKKIKDYSQMSAKTTVIQARLMKKANKAN
jgi:hypothetical protein